MITINKKWVVYLLLNRSLIVEHCSGSNGELPGFVYIYIYIYIYTLKCGSNRCQICTFLCVGRTFRSKTNGKEFRINYNLNCNSKNVVYLITCKVCGIQYVGSTTTTFRSRFNNHRKMDPFSFDIFFNNLTFVRQFCHFRQNHHFRQKRQFQGAPLLRHNMFVKVWRIFALFIHFRQCVHFWTYLTH